MKGTGSEASKSYWSVCSEMNRTVHAEILFSSNTVDMLVKENNSNPR
jgi:hypothetical protein